MPKAETILSPESPRRSTGRPFREVLAWKRAQRANAIRRHNALRRGDPEAVTFIDLDALDPGKQPASRLSFDAWAS